ncbi:MAG TPA: FtsX-like permease family protein [Ktedonobacterales bacterium]|nr:FtsX-like permease family protein [Ktedonobacterales bacterium]
MKVGLYFSYATRSLIREGQRTLLAIFCVAVGVMAIVALQLVGNMVNLGLTSNVREDNGGDISVRADIVPLRASDLTFFDQLKAKGDITGYTAVSGHSAQTPQANGSISFYTLDAVNPNTFPLDGSPSFISPSGGSFASVLKGQTVVITASLQTELGVKVGDKVTVSSDDGRVVHATIGGIIASANFFRGTNMYISLSGYAAIPSSAGLPVNYSGVYVNVPGHTDAAADKAKKLISNQIQTATAVTTTKDALQQNQSQVQNIRYFLQVVGLLALLIGGIGIINTMQVLLRRRQTEIAMLKTTGYTRTDLYLLFGLEAAILGLIGGIVGAAAGVGVSFFVKTLVERAFFIQLPNSVDPLTVASGVAIGFATALIFGLMPIVQAAQVRPLAVLREVSEGLQGTSIALTLTLAVLLALLFYALAALILGNPGVALGAVGGTGIFLGLLALFFFLIVFLISKFPIPDQLTWWYALIVGVGLIVGGLLTVFSTAFGSLILLVALLAAIAVFLPRTPKSNVRMALRNIGRQRGRTVTTMVALFVGVFTIGLILVLSQNIRDEINQVLSTQVKYNSYILAGAKDKASVDHALKTIPDASLVQGEIVNPIAQDIPVSVNGVPIGKVISGTSRPGAGSTGREGALALLSGVEGYNLAAGQLPPGVKLVPGYKATTPGRLLTRSDAGLQNGAYNILAPRAVSLAPLNLKVGDEIVLASQLAAAGSNGQISPGGKLPPGYVTLRIVGFYSGGTNAVFASLIGDNSAVNALTFNNPIYVYQLRIDPTKSDTVLHEVQKKVPSIQTFSLADLLLIINTLLTNLVILLTAIASLAMIAGLIIIANAVGLAMLERRRELGILKSVGYTSSNVLGQVLVENGMVGLAGALLAMLLVSLAIGLLGQFLFKTSFGVTALLVLAIVGVTALVCMIVAAGVAWSATRVRPLEVLRYE